MLRSKIVLVDDERILLDGIKALVEPEFDVAATYDNCIDMLDEVAEIRPDVVILDVNLAVLSGLSAGEHLKQTLPKTKLIYLTVNRDLETVAEAFRLGASGYVLKSAAGPDLIFAIREVLRGGFYASPVLTEGMIGSFVRAFKEMKPAHHLTSRQQEVLKLLLEGRSMKEVARVLHITPRTVAFHKYSMMDQLHITNNAELLKYANTHVH